MSADIPIRFGAGFHPGLLSSDPTRGLPQPEGVSFVEGGVRELQQWSTRGVSPAIDFSLHLARTPITDPDDAHLPFIDHIRRSIAGAPVCSIGIHLCGPRSTGLGRLGMSSHYAAEHALEQRAIRFVSLMRKHLNAPIWLENANYYTGSASEVVENWRSFTRIVEATGAKVIADLTHLYIEAKNLGLSPEVFLGLIPWSHVVEIHLAGVIAGRDGALHDGHSQTIAPEIWQLLDLALAHFLHARDEELVITVEHTDLIWSNRREVYQEDFARAQELAAASRSRARPSRASAAVQYGIGYLQRLLLQRIPGLDEAIAQPGWNLRSLVEEWISDLTLRGHGVALSIAEVSPEERAMVEDLAPSFLSFLKEKARRSHAVRS